MKPTLFIIPSTDLVERDIHPATRSHPPSILSLFFVISILHINYRPLINSSIFIHILFIILVILYVYVSFIKIHKKNHKNLHFCFRLQIGFQKCIPVVRPYRLAVGSGKLIKTYTFVSGYKSASKSPFWLFAHKVLLSDPEPQSIRKDWLDPCLQQNPLL